MNTRIKNMAKNSNNNIINICIYRLFINLSKLLYSNRLLFALRFGLNGPPYKRRPIVSTSNMIFIYVWIINVLNKREIVRPYSNYASARSKKKYKWQYYKTFSQHRSQIIPEPRTYDAWSNFTANLHRSQFKSGW